MTIHTVCETMSQNLAVKAAAMNSFKEMRALTASLANDADNSIVPEQLRAKLRTMIQLANENAYRKLRIETKSSMTPMDQQLFALWNMPLADKHKLLNAMPIITVPIGAAFLGVAEGDLHDINSQSRGAFGNVYMGRRCNSMNELMLIAKNPGWFRYRPHLAPALVTSDPEMLYAMTFVDISTATSYTNMTLQELQMQAQDIYRFHRCNFTYRVSDLEDIRIAKLKALQQ